MLDSFFVSPNYLFGLLGLIILMLLFRNTNKRIYFVRIVIIVLLVFAIAEPYTPSNLFGDKPMKIEILEDDSNSYNIFEEVDDEKIIKELKKQIKVKYSRFGRETTSNVGSSVMDSLENGNNVLLISDGNVNVGETLEMAKDYALEKGLNINLLKKNVVEEDYSIKIVGPEKVSPDVESIFSVLLGGTDEKSKNLVLFVDGVEVLRDNTRSLEYKNVFLEGYHKLEARILDEDYFEENNVFYKTVKVVKKPKILFVGDKSSGMYKILSKFSDIVVGNLINFEAYHGIVIDDKKISEFSNKISRLEEYVQEGNGLLVLGGENSFEFDENYENSEFESLLPVKLGNLGKKSGGANLVILIDLSGSTGENSAASGAQSLSKEIINNMGKNHRVGVILFSEDIIDTWNLESLEDIDMEELASWITRSPSNDHSLDLESALWGAFDMLKGESGDKNLILLGDGSTGSLDLSYASTTSQSNGLKPNSHVLGNLSEKNIKIYSVGVGESVEKNKYERLSSIVGGEYYSDFISVGQLSLLFGNPSQDSENLKTQIKIFDDSHYITQDLITDASIYGTNQVIPKDSSILLVTSGFGDPLLTVWRKGLGRIAVLSSDDGSEWAGEIYKGINSRLINRIFSWISGDPERNEDYFFNIEDARVGEEATITIKGTEPLGKEFNFEKVEEDLFVAKFEPTNAGFFNFEDNIYSVNYNIEYESLGLNENLERIIASSGGKVYENENFEDLLEFSGKSTGSIGLDKELFIWPLIAMAMALFLIDVWFRHINERKNI